MEYSPLLVPFLQIIGIAVLLVGVFGLTLLYLSSSYGKKDKKIVDAEFTEVPPQRSYAPGDMVDKKA